MYKIQRVKIMAIDYADIGQRIKAKRIEKSLTQEKLSELIGVGPSHMSHIESGKTGPSFEVFVSILNALNCSADAHCSHRGNTLRISEVVLLHDIPAPPVRY